MSKPSVQVVFDLNSNECVVVVDGINKPTTRHRIHVEFNGGSTMKFDKWPSEKSKKNQ
jgi:hypothetical protein